MNIYSIISKIQQYAEEWFKNDSNVLSIFVVGSMCDLQKYTLRKNNDYDIRILVDTVTPTFLKDMNKLQDLLLEKFEKESIHVECSNLVGPVNHNLSSADTNLLIHMLVHEKRDLKDFLPLSHQCCYRLYHNLIWGEDYLQDICKDYPPEYLIDSHEGIDYCVDMLRRKVYKYLKWECDDCNQAVFRYYEEPLPENLYCESVFYSLKNILNNLYHCCVLNRTTAPVSLLSYCQFLCGDNEKYQYTY